MRNGGDEAGVIDGCALWFFFFFSSRRRHTRLVSDWSSDVCSSDLLWVREVLRPRAIPPPWGRRGSPVPQATRLGPRYGQRERGHGCLGTLGAPHRSRSEERRVGKEWRSRGWPYQ